MVCPSFLLPDTIPPEFQGEIIDRKGWPIYCCGDWSKKDILSPRADEYGIKGLGGIIDSQIR
jgi:hypothetical protein